MSEYWGQKRKTKLEKAGFELEVQFKSSLNFKES